MLYALMNHRYTARCIFFGDKLILFLRFLCNAEYHALLTGIALEISHLMNFVHGQ